MCECQFNIFWELTRIRCDLYVCFNIIEYKKTFVFVTCFDKSIYKLVSQLEFLHLPRVFTNDIPAVDRDLNVVGQVL